MVKAGYNWKDIDKGNSEMITSEIDIGLTSVNKQLLILGNQLMKGAKI